MSKPSQSNAVLVAIRTPRVTAEEVDSSLQELTRLVKTLGYHVVGRVTQKRSSDRYAAVLGEIFPERRIEAALVWTDGPRLMPVPENMMAEALSAALARYDT